MTGPSSKTWRLAAVLLLGVTLSSGAIAKENSPKQRAILGWVEFVHILPWGFQTKGKLDTGAKTSSIHARNIEVFERKGKDWARFDFEFKDAMDDKVREVKIEAPVVRTVHIKRHNSKTQSRPVVMLEICINNKTYKSEFSLIDRTRFIYPILLGRRLLKESAIVDAGNTFLADKACDALSKSKAKD